jgi:hypothetical protein
MKIELTLHQKELEEAVKEYLDRKGFFVTGSVRFAASQATDYTDQPTGSYVVSAKTDAKTKEPDTRYP